MLLNRFLALLSLWRPVFQRERRLQRAVRQAVGALLVVGSATWTRIWAGLGRDQQDGSADYKLHARAEWEEQALFEALLPSALAHGPGQLLHRRVGHTPSVCADPGKRGQAACRRGPGRTR